MLAVEEYRSLKDKVMQGEPEDAAKALSWVELRMIWAELFTSSYTQCMTRLEMVLRIRRKMNRVLF